MSEGRVGGCFIFCPRIFVIQTRNVSLLTDSESHPRPSPDLINSNTCLKLRPGPEHRLGAASISAITRHDYPETEGEGRQRIQISILLTYIRGGGYQQHVSPESPPTNVNVTAPSLPLIVDNVTIIRKRINSDHKNVSIVHRGHCSLPCLLNFRTFGMFSCL